MDRIRLVVSCALMCTLTLVLLASPLAAAEPATAVPKPPAAKTTAKPTPKPATRPAPAVQRTSIVHSYGRNAAQRRIDSVLDQPLSSPLEFIETPINQIAQLIAEHYDIPIVIDVESLKAAGLTPEEEATVTIGNVSLKSALRLLLQTAGDNTMTYILDNEVILITTPEVAAKHLETRIYPVGELIVALKSGPQPAAAGAAQGKTPPPVDEITELADALILTISPQTWRRNGTGAGDVQKIGDKYLVVLQTQSVHEEIESFLQHLAAASGDDVRASATTVSR
jgi:hypothetical protein